MRGDIAERLRLQLVAELHLGITPHGAPSAACPGGSPEEAPLVGKRLERRRGRVVGADERDSGLVGDGDEMVQLDGVADRPWRDRGQGDDQ